MAAQVLIIEDNATNLELMAYLLQAAGYAVSTAADGEQGVATALRELPDLVICDVQMPKLDGYGVAQQLKEHSVMGWRPLVAVTALAMVGDRDRILAAGFDGYIPKPIFPETFAQQIKDYLNSRPRHARKQAVAQAGSQRLHGGNILMVDNVQANLDTVQQTLAPSGFAVACALSIADAQASAFNRPPDLILTDLHLRGEHGFDLIRLFKGDAHLRHIPIVVMTSTLLPIQDRKQALALGAVDFIERPIEPQQLVGKIKSYLDSAAPSRQALT